MLHGHLGGQSVAQEGCHSHHPSLSPECHEPSDYSCSQQVLLDEFVMCQTLCLVDTGGTRRQAVVHALGKLWPACPMQCVPPIDG